MTHVFGRGKAPLRKAVRGEGCYLYDDQGRAYLDGSGGAAVSCLGHSDAGVRAAMHAQLDQLAFAHTGFFTSEPAEALADLLIANAPEGIDKTVYCSAAAVATQLPAERPLKTGGSLSPTPRAGRRAARSAPGGSNRWADK